MKTYTVWASEVITHRVEVEAETPEEAEDKALEIFDQSTIVDGEHLEVFGVREVEETVIV